MANPAPARSLAMHILGGFTAVILLTALAMGIPAIWLMRSQLEQRAFAQLEQGLQAVESLVAARQAELRGLAMLTSQRPTLQALLEAGETAALNAYLERLRNGAGVDMLVVCSRPGGVVGFAGTAPPKLFCEPAEPDGVYRFPGTDNPQAWMLAAAEITGVDAPGYDVVAGDWLDDNFARQVREQLGMEYGLWTEGVPLASSFAEKIAYIPQPIPGREQWLRFTRDGKDYYGYQVTLPGAQVVEEISLDVSQIRAAQNQFLRVMIVSILAVTGLGLGLGLLLSRRISHPLQALAEAAGQVSETHQPQALAVQSNVREVAQLTAALNRASRDLQVTLQQLQHEKEWGEQLLEAIVEGIVTLDTQARITFFSHGAEQITGWRRADVLGKPASQVFRSADFELFLNEAVTMPGKAQKLVVELPSGQAATLAVTRAGLAPTGAGEGETALVFRDITHEELIHHLLGQFLANIAHEFRTPLSALAASAELLLDQAGDLSRDELHELLTSLHVSIINLQTLIDNLLESASIEAGRFHITPRPVELQSLVSEAERIMVPLLDKYRQRLVLVLPDEPLLVLADPRRITQVLVNLLSNANKYGPVEAEITLQAAQAGGMVRVEVIDRGVGIPADLQQQLFKRFAYPDQSESGVKVGVGLGLSVVKSVVEAHGGQVGVLERSGGGSRFWFTLPLVSEQ